MPRPRSPTFAQLCAIARDEIARDPTIDDAEWRARIKATIARRRLAYPLPGPLTDAMERVERARSPRPVPLPLTPANDDGEEQHTARDVEPLSGDEAREAMARLVQRFGSLPAMKLRVMPSGESDLMTTRERYATVALIERLRDLHRQQRARAATQEHVDDKRKGEIDADRQSVGGLPAARRPAHGGRDADP